MFAMGYRIAVISAGICFELFGFSNLLYIFIQPSMNQNQVMTRAIPYSLLIIAGLGILSMRNWGRYMAIAIAFTGLLLQSLDIVTGSDIRDLFEAAFYIVFLIVLTRRPIEQSFK